ncbi:coniferyl aldehyde dehydrogenase [Paraburkholderia humisilvae]|uniref:Aldehyde dehydrogenase n=1 Tax=Paraburkholderia humisilvae TaxID=627669 RepID=A0A6J5CXL5_9BURK|nr:coniferyl aldehyde dehydrogenase [Paraburkholderia humisilvae]CAB3745881.1 Coniferyl aldehyde dehydrogenase [Paraburkholderia humisilvae]
MNAFAEPIHPSQLEALFNQQRQAFLSQPAPDISKRKAQLAMLRSAVLAFRDEIETAISADFGNRSRHETGIMELAGVVQAIDYLSRKLRRFMKRQRRHVGLFYRAGQAYVEYQPKGIIGVMAPWNYPISLTMIPLATAIAAGNRVMLKPSELTPRTSEVIKRMLAETFATEDVAVVLGGPAVGAEFSGLPFDHLLFTGSTQVGRQVMKAASDHLVPLTLELGGKSPVIVSQGHINDQTMKSIVFGKLSNGGQTCVAPDYALVHEDDRDAFVKAYTDTVARFYPDGPTSVDYTSIVSDGHHARLLNLVEDARQKGAKVIETGVNPERAITRIRTFAPTLIIDANDQMAVMHEEIFGPILPVCTYRTIDEVIEYVNNRPRPLALYYFGYDNDERDAVLRRTTSGNVGVNNAIMHVAQDDLPFGGIGPSGMGAYHGIEGFRAMSHAKGVFVQSRWSLARLLHAPFGSLANFALVMTLGRSRKRAADGKIKLGF